MWTPPTRSLIKVNVDGFFVGFHRGEIGVYIPGSGLENHAAIYKESNIVFIFPCQLSCLYLVVQKCFLITVASRRTNSYGFSFEFDSSKVVKWFEDPISTPWRWQKYNLGVQSLFRAHIFGRYWHIYEGLKMMLLMFSLVSDHLDHPSFSLCEFVGCGFPWVVFPLSLEYGNWSRVSLYPFAFYS